MRHKLPARRPRRVENKRCRLRADPRRWSATADSSSDKPIRVSQLPPKARCARQRLEFAPGILHVGGGRKRIHAVRVGGRRHAIGAIDGNRGFFVFKRRGPLRDDGPEPPQLLTSANGVIAAVMGRSRTAPGTTSVGSPLVGTSASVQRMRGHTLVSQASNPGSAQSP